MTCDYRNMIQTVIQFSPCFPTFFFLFFSHTATCKISQSIDELAVVVAQSNDVFLYEWNSCTILYTKKRGTPVLYKQASAPVIVVVANKENKIMWCTMQEARALAKQRFGAPTNEARVGPSVGKRLTGLWIEKRAAKLAGACWAENHVARPITYIFF